MKLAIKKLSPEKHRGELLSSNDFGAFLDEEVAATLHAILEAKKASH